MRLRVGAVLCLFLGFIGAGCRKTLAPTTLDNQPPETWIVAAPQDTITTRDDSNTPIRPGINKIPVRFHLYWAGADRDGSVGGYYWAVVETLPVPPEGSISVPSLPGPKARDYQFTTRTDSIFIFRASEEVSERQHAFYIYSVDNKGRPDPTPARFIFSSYDRFPPKAIIDELRAEGTEYELLPGGGVRPQRKTYFVTDFFEISNDHAVPRDTVPADAFLSMRWHGEPTIPSTVVTGYRYKLDESGFNSVDSSVHTATYNSGVGADRVNAGPKIFTLRAIGQSGWRGESTRWFQMNFAPDSWFAGPDLNDPIAGWQTFQDGNGKRYWFMDFDQTGWTAFHGVPGTMLSDDSVNVLPALRPQHRTFFEVYNNKLWMHAENDTVHLNSWVIVPTGGFDRDSPYSVRVNEALLDSGLVGMPVLTESGPNGSPIGFRIRVPIKDAGGGVTQPSEGTTYPEFDPASVKNLPIVNGVQGMTSAGRAFVEIFAEDGNGTVDRRIDQRPRGSVGIVERVEAGTTNAEDIALRSKILTFYVNKVPRLSITAPSFAPKPTSPPFATRTLSFTLPASDVDQLDPTIFNKVGGNPSYGPLLRRKVAILGKLVGTTRDTCYVHPEDVLEGTAFSIALPLWLEGGNVIARIRLCDCATCDVTQGTATCPFGPDRGAAPGYGSCIETDIPIRVPPAPPIPAEAVVEPTTPRPGSAVLGRRQR